MTARRRAAVQRPAPTAIGSQGPAPAHASAPPDPENAWKLLAIVSEWVRHAEGKLGAALATVGVIGGVLFSLAQGLDRRDVGLDVLCAACALADAIAGLCAIAGLRPRLRADPWPPQEPNPLYFRDIASGFQGVGKDYGTALSEVLADRTALLRHLEQQIQAVSMVARSKYRWADRATMALLFALALLAAVATAVAVRP